jgi:hypothetical protein
MAAKSSPLRRRERRGGAEVTQRISNQDNTALQKTPASLKVQSVEFPITLANLFRSDPWIIQYHQPDRITQAAGYLGGVVAEDLM